MIRMRPALLLAALVLAVSGCPKDDTNTTATPVAIASPAASASATPIAMGTPPASPIATLTATATAATAPFTVRYTWSGGLSIYHHYELAIEGSETAKVVFKVKPMRQDEVTVQDTLDADQVKELMGLFAMVKFDEVKTAPRKVRVMDIGQTLVVREMGGAKHEVMENPANQATTDIKPLRQWLDTKVRLYLDKSGVGPKRSTPAPTPAASPTKTP